jgi:hypothetical protein
MRTTEPARSQALLKEWATGLQPATAWPQVTGPSQVELSGVTQLVGEVDCSAGAELDHLPVIVCVC